MEDLCIISGGQTGVDRAALDVALALGVPCGGFCPRGRMAEDGPIAARYPLEEFDGGYEERTIANVCASDATLIIVDGGVFGGTVLTVAACESLQRPYIIIDCSQGSLNQHVDAVRAWLKCCHPAVLNIAGPRASDAPNIYQQTMSLLYALLWDHSPAVESQGETTA